MLLRLIPALLATSFLFPRCASGAVGGKSHFAPQPLATMLSPLIMPQKNTSPEPAFLLEQQPPLPPQPQVFLPPPEPEPEHVEPVSYLQEKKSFGYHFQSDQEKARLFDAGERASFAYAPVVPRRQQSFAPARSAPKPVLSTMQQLIEPAKSAKNWVFAAMPFYIKSMNSAALCSYYFPNGKRELVVKGSAAPVPAECDVSGTWLKIIGVGVPGHELLENQFQSNFQINPTYEYLGTHLTVQRRTGSWWGEVQLPIAQVSVDHGIREYNVRGNIERIDDSAMYNNTRIENVTTLYSVNAASALSHNILHYNKLSKQPLQKHGLGDAVVKIGWHRDSVHAFGKVVLPTGTRSTNTYMFEPQLGNGGHFGVGIGGLLTQVSAVPSLDAMLNYFGEMDVTYFFSNNQIRTFDIAEYGSFSRYLLYKFYDGAGKDPWYAGVNVLSKKTEVSPGSEINARLSGTLERGVIHLGVTYALRCAAAESLKIQEQFDASYGASHTSSEVGGGGGQHNRFFVGPKIGLHGNDQRNPPMVAAPTKIIRVEDLDLQSATRPLVLTSQIMVSCGWQKKVWDENISLNLVSGMSLSHTNAALATWLLGLNVGLKL